MQIAQLRESRDVYPCLGTDFVPNGFQTHPYDRVEILELGVPDIDVFQVKILVEVLALHIQGCRMKLLTKE